MKPNEDLLDMTRAQLVEALKGLDAMGERCAAIESILVQLDAWAAPVAAAMRDDDKAVMRDEIAERMRTGLSRFKDVHNDASTRAAIQKHIMAQLKTELGDVVPVEVSVEADSKDPSILTVSVKIKPVVSAVPSVVMSVVCDE